MVQISLWLSILFYFLQTAIIKTYETKDFALGTWKDFKQQKEQIKCLYCDLYTCRLEKVNETEKGKLSFSPIVSIIRNTKV